MSISSGRRTLRINENPEIGKYYYELRFGRVLQCNDLLHAPVLSLDRYYFRDMVTEDVVELTRGTVGFRLAPIANEMELLAYMALDDPQPAGDT